MLAHLEALRVSASTCKHLLCIRVKCHTPLFEKFTDTNNVQPWH